MVKSRTRSLLGKEERRRKRIAGGRKIVSGKGKRGGDSRWRGGDGGAHSDSYHPLLAVSLPLLNSSHSTAKQDNTIQWQLAVGITSDTHHAHAPPTSSLRRSIERTVGKNVS